MKAIIVQTTCASKDEAKTIAKILLDEKLAACVHMSDIESFYKWNNEFCEDSEVLLSIKTKKKCYKRIERKIKELHSYDVPEILASKIVEVSKEYKKFIAKNCK